MRRGTIRAVSSALLLALIGSMPHHEPSTGWYVELADQTPDGPFVISEFYPCGLCSDEYLVVSNQNGRSENLFGWTVTDGEGTLLFRSDVWLSAFGSATITWNTTSFLEAFDKLPTISMDSNRSSAVAANGTFRLGDSGDSLALYSPSFVLADIVCYGSGNGSSPEWSGLPIPRIKNGEVVKRVRAGEMFLDTDTASDWAHFREFRYGYTEWATTSRSIGPGKITAFVSPDCSLDVVLETLDQACSRIMLCTYEFSSVSVTESLLRASNRGVSVLLLVDGSPAGGMSEGEIESLSVLAMFGLDVRTVRGNSSQDIVQHIGALHAKYIVVDGSVTIVMSENLVEQGVPRDRLFGNRGWGLRIRDSSFSESMENMLAEDSRQNRRDVIPWSDDPRFNRSSTLRSVPSTEHSMGIFSPMTLADEAMVTAYPSPDCSLVDPFLRGVVRASRSLLSEQFQADLLWEDRWTGSSQMNPIVSDILGMIRGGGSVRALFDGSWYNRETNGEVISSLSENTTRSGLAGEFRLLDERSPITSLHNKGAVFDGRYVLVSSNNWVYASFARNRELALLLDSHEAAQYFANVFELDWTPDVSPPVADAGPDLEIKTGESVNISSARITDDRAVARVGWDIDGDGLNESNNSSVEFAGVVPGSYHLILTVEDTWGNRATDELIVVVVARGGDNAEKDTWIGRIAWTVPLMVGGAILFARLRSRPGAPRAPRKLNHGSRS
jgi:hypothetical protein